VVVLNEEMLDAPVQQSLDRKKDRQREIMVEIEGRQMMKESVELLGEGRARFEIKEILKNGHL
jgi:hypothetical protein